MKKATAIVLATTLVGFIGVSAFADDDHHEKESHKEFKEYRYDNSEEHEKYESGKKERLSRQKYGKYYSLYKKECGSCHMAYQPEFLPKRSWEKMMFTLEDHFGTDASLENKEASKIFTFLTRNSADSKKVEGEFEEIAQSIPKERTLLRISEAPYFVKEHRKIKKELITQKEVKSISNCTACHKYAEEGRYNDRDIFIPNYGKWDD